MDATETQEIKDIDSAESSAETTETSTSLFTLPQTEEEMRHCKHCEFQADDWAKFSEHVFTPDHLRKIAAAYKIRLSTDPIPNTFTCEVCIVDCHGHKPWVAHLLGAKHKKALEQLAIAKAEQKNEIMKTRTGGAMRNNQFGTTQNKKPYDRLQNFASQQSNVLSVAKQEFAQYPEPLIGLEYLMEIQVAGESPRYDCTVCNAKFDHNLKFPHLVGQKHRLNVLKLKRPSVVKGLTHKKRSEITIVLTQESANLEREEGRQLVKAKVKDLPFSFNPNYSQQNNSARGFNRGGRGGSQRKTWNTRGGRGGHRGAHRGAQRGASSNTSRGASRGSWSNRGTSQLRENNLGHSYESYPHSSSGPYPAYDSSYEMTSNSNFDNSSYSGSYMQSTDQPHPGQAYPGNTFQSPSSGYTNSAPPPQISHPPPQISHLPPQISHPDRNMPSEGTSAKGGGVSTGLAGALGDLTKLVQNEDDASVALQVSNALTQALLKYRMGSELKGET